jgi:ComF family protein
MLKQLFNWLLPPTCLLCGDPGQPAIDLCVPCQQELPWIQRACIQCALPLPLESPADQRCGHCLHYAAPFAHTIALWHYETPVDHFISALKFSHQLVYACLMGELLAQRLQHYYSDRALPDFIIPVPLHRQRLRDRGFNQALEIARPIVKKLAAPIKFNCCERVRATEPQTLLPVAERRRNLKNAFAVTQNVAGKHIAVLDDVITTGQTIRELCKTLRKAGAKQIDIWCCARTAR